MPRFSEVGDSTAVNNSYSDKVIVYVEGADDALTFYGITGHQVREFLEFQTPRVEGSGVEPVVAQVRADRPANPKVFGLVDGEAAAKFGMVELLLDCTDLFFQADRPDLEGVLFLAQHEMENILLLYGELAELIRRDVEFKDFNSITVEAAQKRITKVAKLFFLAALLKYASLTLNHRAWADGREGCGAIDSSRFLRDDDWLHILQEIKDAVATKGLTTWQELKDEVRWSYLRVRARLRTSGAGPEAVARERLRLADGKSVLKRLKHEHSQDGRWPSHLLSSIGGSDFGTQFRERLLAMTQAEVVSGS